VKTIPIALTRSLRLRVLLFLLLWFAYGCAINSRNLYDFDLQQIGVEAMVERGHFYLEGASSPQMETKGDVFEYNGHKYAAKQPGQFFAGSVIYFVLHKLGLNYVDNYLITSALVTFFTTALLLSASAVAFFTIAKALANNTSPFWPLAATLSYALGTTVFPFSGIAHHDALATAYLVITFCFLFRLTTRRDENTERLDSGIAGLLLGLTITTSMLPFFIVIVCLIYFLSLRRWRLLPWFLGALTVGLVPLFVYDTASFGSPLRLANLVGAAAFSDTFWHFDPRNLGNKIAFYARAMFYVPIFVVGLFGLSYYPRKVLRSPQFLLLFASMIVLAVYVFNIGSDGDCQFGPRYLLPTMPLACLGIMGYSYLSGSWERTAARLVIVIAGAISFFINLVGALGGAMNCPHGENAFRIDLAMLSRGEGPAYPLAKWLILPAVICGVWFVLELRRPGKRQRYSAAVQKPEQ